MVVSSTIMSSPRHSRTSASQRLSCSMLCDMECPFCPARNCAIGKCLQNGVQASRTCMMQIFVTLHQLSPMEHIVFLDRATIRARFRTPAFAHTWRDHDETAPDEVVPRLAGATIAITN